MTKTTMERMEAIEKAVRDFHDRVYEVEHVTARLGDVLSIPPDAPLTTAIWQLIGGYRDALGAAYGIEGWLDWWWIECNLGGTPMDAAPVGGEMRKISTVDDLVRLVCDDLAKEEKP